MYLSFIPICSKQLFKIFILVFKKHIVKKRKQSRFDMYYTKYGFACKQALLLVT